MTALTAEERRARVQRVRAAAADLTRIENALSDAAARLPALQREVAHIRKQITDALAPAAGEEPEE